MTAISSISVGRAPTKVVDLTVKPYVVDYTGPYATSIPDSVCGGLWFTCVWENTYVNFRLTLDECDAWSDLFLQARTVLVASTQSADQKDPPTCPI